MSPTQNDLKPGQYCVDDEDNVAIIVSLSNEHTQTPNQKKRFPLTVNYAGLDGKLWSQPATEFSKRYKVEKQLRMDEPTAILFDMFNLWQEYDYAPKTIFDMARELRIVLEQNRLLIDKP